MSFATEPHVAAGAEAMDARLARLPAVALRAGAFGLEREALRVTRAGELAQTPHPAAFGDKLGTGGITVDFSESQLELVTAPAASIEAAHAELAALHTRVRSVLATQDEQLWPFSMPPSLPAEDRIPIARFADTADGRRRALYRLGLANRYGRRMQVISGIHMNMSFGAELLRAVTAGEPGSRVDREARDAAYFRTIRNFLRDRWLLVLLTGASPVLQPSTAAWARLGATRDAGVMPSHRLDRRPPATGRRDSATTLRASRRGYANTGAAESLSVSHRDAGEYVRDIHRLLHARSARFAALGTGLEARPRQLNDRVLQLEKEFYAPIRPKGAVRAGESHVDAIERDGVAYLEIRLLDVNPFVPEGVDLATMRLVHLFALDCLAGDPRPFTPDEISRADENHERVALAGRRPGLRLLTADGESAMTALALARLARLERIADLLDRDLPAAPYRAAVESARRGVLDTALLPSARVAALEKSVAVTRAPETAHHEALHHVA